MLEEDHIDKKTKQAHTNAMLLSLSSDLFLLSFMTVIENGSCLESVICSACPSFVKIAIVNHFSIKRKCSKATGLT